MHRLLGTACGCSGHTSDTNFKPTGAMTTVMKFTRTMVQKMMRKYAGPAITPLGVDYHSCGGTWFGDNAVGTPSVLMSPSAVSEDLPQVEVPVSQPETKKAEPLPSPSPSFEDVEGNPPVEVNEADAFSAPQPALVSEFKFPALTTDILTSPELDVMLARSGGNIRDAILSHKRKRAIDAAARVKDLERQLIQALGEEMVSRASWNRLRPISMTLATRTFKSSKTHELRLT